jgi:hypothetical protein
MQRPADSPCWLDAADSRAGEAPGPPLCPVAGTEKTDDGEDLERRNWNSLVKAAAVGVLCLLGIVVAQAVRRFLNSIARSHAVES